MVTTLPILSEIIKGVVARVSVITEADPDDPFAVSFAVGPENEVAKEIDAATVTFPVVWLVEKGESRKAKVQDTYGIGTFDIVIGTESDNTWTMDQRIDQNFKPRLWPIYELFIQELKKEKNLNSPYKIDHTKYNLYYWGGGPPNTTDNERVLFQKRIDAVLMEGVIMGIKYKC